MRERRLSQELAAALDTLSKAVLSQPTDPAADRRLILRPLLIKGERRFQLERQRGTQAFHENLSAESLLRQAADWDGRYRQALIVTEERSAQYSLRQNGLYKLSVNAALPRPGGAEAGHDRKKRYLLPEGEPVPALVDLGVFTPDYRVVKARYDKYRQINRFVELIDQGLGEESGPLTVLDFGCGKSYLTFILYYYLREKRGLDAQIIGYDLKADVVERCSAVAAKYGYDRLRFVRADVTKDALYGEKVDMVVSLHACDTATDYALRYAIDKGVRYLFSVPCCQHEINNSIRRGGGDLDELLRYGIVKERVSALLTDTIRAGVLEDAGYEVDLIEFTDLENSPKNLMIRAKKSKVNNLTRNDRLETLRSLSARYGFTQTLLDQTKAAP